MGETANGFTQNTYAYIKLLLITPQKNIGFFYTSPFKIKYLQFLTSLLHL